MRNMLRNATFSGFFAIDETSMIVESDYAHEVYVNLMHKYSLLSI